MEIYPRAQLLLLLSAFLAGLASGVLWDALAALRVLLGAYRPPDFMRERYARELPLLHRAPVWRDAAAKRVLRHAVTLCLDVLFCLAVALIAILLLYEYNDGVVRPFAVFVLLAGLAVWRVVTARYTERLVAILAYALSVVWLYLRALITLPPRLLWRLVRACVLRPVRALMLRVRAKRMARVSEALCREQLALADCGLDAEKRKKEGSKDSEAKKKDRHDGDAHSRIGRGRILRRGSAHRGTSDGAEPNASRDRGAAGGKGALGTSA